MGAFARRIVQINGQNAKYLVFHTGLKRRSDDKLLFCLLAPNNVSEATRYKQKWRVSFGNIRDSFLTQSELLRTLKRAGITMSAHNLPQRTAFAESMMDSVYDPSYNVEVSWEERLITNQDRIYKVLGSDAFFDRSKKFLKLTELIQAFNKALSETQRMAASDRLLVVPQLFVDTKNSKYRLELLLPLNVWFMGKVYNFALAVSPSIEKRQTYSVKSVLTLEMAYNNARLVKFVDSKWLKKGNSSNK